MSKVIISFAIKGDPHAVDVAASSSDAGDCGERGESCGGRSGDRPLYARNPDDGRPLAIPDEARDILKLKGGDKVRVLT
jgi:hypothetical protein